VPYLFSLLAILLFGTPFLAGCGQNSINAPALATASSNTQSNTSQSAPHLIALLLPLQGALSPIAQAVKQGFLAAAQENGNSPQIIVVDTSKEPTIQAAYSKALEQKAQLVVGPLLKSQVQTLAGLQLITPILALNYLNQDISTPAELYQFGLSPLDEAREAAGKAWQNGRRSALIITANGSWGAQIGQAFAEEWKNLGGNIVDRLALSQTNSMLTRQIRLFLQFKPPHDRRTDFDVIFLVSDPKLGRQINPLLKFFYASNIPVYATAAIYSGQLNRRLDNDLNPIIFCSAPWTLGINKPYPLLYERLQAANSPNFFRRHRSYYALGVDASHLAQQLSRLEQSTSQTLAGATGQLTLNNQHRIVRQLPCAQFRNGHLVLIN
jgi:uncharacterized protein